MTLKVVRVGDGTTCGDAIAAGSPNVFANNIPVGRITDPTTGHGCFPSTTIAAGSSTVFANNLKLSRVTDAVNPHCCGGCHGQNIAAGSPNVWAGG